MRRAVRPGGIGRAVRPALVLDCGDRHAAPLVQSAHGALTLASLFFVVDSADPVAGMVAAALSMRANRIRLPGILAHARTARTAKSCALGETPFNAATPALPRSFRRPSGRRATPASPMDSGTRCALPDG